MPQVAYDYLSFWEMVEGLNTVSAGIRLKPGEFRDIQDMEYFPIGGFLKRDGYDALNDDPIDATAGWTGLYMAHTTVSGGTNTAYGVAGSKLYSMAGGLGGTWTDITGGLTITDGDNNIWSFAMLNDITVLGNGTDNSIQISSGGSASALTGAGGTVTKFLFPLESRGYMFYFVPTVSGTTYWDRAYFSDINDPATTGANSFMDIAKGSGGEIRGAVEYKNFVYIFKKHGIHQIAYQPQRIASDGTTFPWTEHPNPTVPGVGTQSHNSIVKFTTPATHVTPGQELVFFVDQFGSPRIFDGRTTLSFNSKIGRSRDSTIKSLSDMDTTRTKYAFSINYPAKNQIFCFLSEGATQTDTCWVFDYNVGFAIARYAFNDPFNCGALFEKSDGTFKPYVGDYAGTVYELDTGTTDNGSPINDYAVTRDGYLKNPSHRSNWHEIDIRGQNGTTTQNTKISYYIDGDDTPTKSSTISLAKATTKWSDKATGTTNLVWGQGKWGKKGLINRVLEINMVSKSIKIKIESADKLNDTLIVEGFSVAGQRLGTSQV